MNCKPTDKHTYSKIKKIVKKCNSVTINSMTIAGEGVYGTYSIITILTFLHKHITDDTYHPYLFKYYIGVSIGAILIDLILKTRFLYEIHGKKKALEYLDAIFEFLVFSNIRNAFYDPGNSEPLSLLSIPTILKNITLNGSLFQRTALENLLLGNYKDLQFNNSENYFMTNEFYYWLQPNLENVFYICYTAQQTKMIIFTGNINRFKEELMTVSYELLTVDNYLHAIICSSSIPVIYPVKKINGRDFCTDGASAQINQSWILQMLINCVYYFNSYEIYKPILDFFEILPDKNDEFLISHNKLNIQYEYENLKEFQQSDIPIIQSLQILFEFFPRALLNVRQNIPLMSLFLNQPFIPGFSNGNMNDTVLEGYERKKKNILENIEKLENIENMHTETPLHLLYKSKYKKIYPKKSYSKYLENYKKNRVFTANQLISTYLYCQNDTEKILLTDTCNKPLLDSNGKKVELNLNVCYFDMNIRTMYVMPFFFLIDLFINKSNPGNKQFTELKKLGVISGNMLYDITVMQQYTTHNTKLITDENTKTIIQDINKIIAKASERFLGKQT
jgi:hypothetical protein